MCQCHLGMLGSVGTCKGRVWSRLGSILTCWDVPRPSLVAPGLNLDVPGLNLDVLGLNLNALGSLKTCKNL